MKNVNRDTFKVCAKILKKKKKKFKTLECLSNFFTLIKGHSPIFNEFMISIYCYN